MYEVEECRELYYKEIEHTERLNSRINTCITFLTIIGSGVILVWTQLKDFRGMVQFWVYLVLCVLSSVSLLVCIVVFYKAYSGYEIHYYPIKGVEVACKQTYKLVEDGKIKDYQAEQHIKNMKCERYLKDAIHNREQNTLKNNRYRRLIQWIAISFIILLINYAVGIFMNNCKVDDKVNSCNCWREVKIMSGSSEEIKLTQTTINGVPLPQTPQAEVITESFDLKRISTGEKGKQRID